MEPKISTRKVIQPANGERVFIPLSDLVLSPYNVRKNRNGDLEGLAATILAQGVLQNLSVHTMKKKGRATGKSGVAAGGRRLAAMELLASRKLIATDYPVPCLVVSEERAVEISLAENSHEPMHPADEFEAFKSMLEGGKGVEDTAAAFGVAPLIVRRRLKLANVSPRLFALYREGKANLEQLMALTITDDHAAQELAWDGLPPHNRNAFSLRRCLTENEVDASNNPLALFVGIDAYENAGGGVRRDLFSNNNSGYLTDMPLLESLALTKLEQGAELLQVHAEGWAWVDVRTSFDHTERAVFGHVNREQREPTEAEREQLAAIAKAQEEAEEKRDAIEGDDDESNAAYAALDEKVGALYEQAEAIEEGLFCVSKEAMSMSGAVVSIDANSGELIVFRGLIRPEDKPKKSNAGNGNDTGDTTRPLHSERLVRMLTAQRTAALQAALSTRPDVALAALVDRMASQVLDDYSYGEGILQISLRVSYLKTDAPGIEQSRAMTELLAQREAWLARMPNHEDESRFLWLLNQPQETVLALLAFCAACSVQTVQSREDALPGVNELGRAVSMDMADWWTPTAESYLSHVKKSRLVDVVTEAVSAEAAAPLASMKKPDAVKAAEVRLEGSRWLPSVLLLA